MTDTDASHLGPATVLIVEDEQNLADLYANWLSETYDVHTAYDGETALAELDSAIDVVLLDRRMPGLSGDDVLDEIRDRGLDCRVVIVSAVTPDFDVIGMGFDDYLTKPVSTEELHDAVERMLTRADYDETVQEFHQLAATKATLEAHYGKAELDASDDFAALQDRLTTVREAANEAVTEFGAEDYEAAFRDLGN